MVELNEQLQSINAIAAPIQNNVKDIPTHLAPAFIISDINNRNSVVAVRRLIKSIDDTESDLQPTIFPATTPATLDRDLKRLKKSKADWTYPRHFGHKFIHKKTGMSLTGYRTDDINKVIACAVSHMRIWQIVSIGTTPTVVLEHDAEFTRKFSFSFFNTRNLNEIGILGLNDPRGATRKAAIYLQKILDAYKTVGQANVASIPVPWVDNNEIAPQGLAGNSAYIITPKQATLLLQRVNEVGIWPNDALMCKQLFPQLNQAYPFFTRVQGVASTTTG
tara:strand:- start:438 stop:1268 length:831 start_codon:yes stop_codon:yes gene_type:complete